MYMSLRSAMLVCGSFNWQRIRRELKQAITLEEV
jgi:hypothetical protein